MTKNALSSSSRRIERRERTTLKIAARNSCLNAVLRIPIFNYGFSSQFIGSIANKIEIVQEFFPQLVPLFWFRTSLFSSKSVVSQVLTTFTTISRFSQRFLHSAALWLWETYITELSRNENIFTRRNVFHFQNNLIGPPAVLTDEYSARIFY